MKNFIDIHCHCLPGVDDGAEDQEKSIQMILDAYADGITEIICTPHFHYKRGQAPRETVEHVFHEIREAIEQACPGMKLHFGNELYYHNDLCDRLNEGTVCTLAGTEYVLVEFSPGAEYGKIRGALLKILQEGYYPILAHVERYQCILKQPELAEELTNAGVYLQVNADAVLGRAGFRTKRFIRKLFQKDLVSFVATDAHDSKNRRPQLSICADHVAKKFGEDTAMRCFFENQRSVIMGKRL